MKDEKLTAIRKIARRKMFFRAASRILKCFISINIRFFKILGKLIGHDDMECNLMMAFSEVSEKYSKYHIQYNLYPKKIENANNWVHYKSCNADKMCIVIQGPIRREKSYNQKLWIG